MLALAHKRISDRPDKYVDHIRPLTLLALTILHAPFSLLRRRAA